MNQIKLNLGCGSQTPDGWVNVDYSWGAIVAKIPFFPSINTKLKLFNLNWNPDIFIQDLTKKFYWSDREVDVIYTSHTLEHLNKSQGLHFLQECYRVLKKDGVIRIVVPDLKPIIDKYINGYILAEYFVENLQVLYNTRLERSIKSKFAFFVKFPHQCMYDSSSLIRIMSSVGFQCQNKKAFESEIDDINNIELKERTIEAVIVEGKKM